MPPHATHSIVSVQSYWANRKSFYFKGNNFAIMKIVMHITLESRLAVYDNKRCDIWTGFRSIVLQFFILLTAFLQVKCLSKRDDRVVLNLPVDKNVKWWKVVKSTSWSNYIYFSKIQNWNITEVLLIGFITVIRYFLLKKNFPLKILEVIKGETSSKYWIQPNS